MLPGNFHPILNLNFSVSGVPVAKVYRAGKPSSIFIILHSGNFSGRTTEAWESQQPIFSAEISGRSRQLPPKIQNPGMFRRFLSGHLESASHTSSERCNRDRIKIMRRSLSVVVLKAAGLSLPSQFFHYGRPIHSAFPHASCENHYPDNL